MASRRAQRRRECERKRHYGDRPSADAALRRTRGAADADNRDGLQVYACPVGDGWVVGHKPGTLLNRPAIQKAIARGHIHPTKKGRSR